MSTPTPSATTASTRRLAEAATRALLARIAPTHQRLAASARRRLRTLLPTAHELVYEYRDAVVISYSPTEQGHLGVLAIRASADGVKLYFNRGKVLPDPKELLRGSAGSVRWIQLESASTMALPAVAQLMKQAAAATAVPFARAGRGPTVVRATTASRKNASQRNASRNKTGRK
ncbi:MAG: hypothetical protein U0636_00975 [Phycisphaerales bacterium]